MMFLTYFDSFWLMTYDDFDIFEFVNKLLQNLKRKVLTWRTWQRNHYWGMSYWPWAAGSWWPWLCKWQCSARHRTCCETVRRMDEWMNGDILQGLCDSLPILYIYSILFIFFRFWCIFSTALQSGVQFPGLHYCWKLLPDLIIFDEGWQASMWQRDVNCHNGLKKCQKKEKGRADFDAATSDLELSNRLSVLSLLATTSSSRLQLWKRGESQRGWQTFFQWQKKAGRRYAQRKSKKHTTH